jgi:glycosyltransferase involved in cell wall biosynthesis/acetyltransferase-like isoleucine patch superfamily enzyme
VGKASHDWNGATLRPLNISIVMGPFFPTMPGPCGAVEMVWQGLADEFARKGHNVVVLAKAWEDHAADEVVNGVRYIRRTAYTSGKSIYRNLAKDFLYSARRLRELPRADILVTNVFWLPAIASRLKTSAGHVVMNVQRQPRGQYWMYSRVSRLAAVSQAIRDAILLENPRLAERTVVFPNPVNIDVFKPSSKERWSGSGQTILYTGRIHPEKGIHVLVEAFRRVHQHRPFMRLRVTGASQIQRGGGGPDYVRKLQAAAEGLPVEFCEPVYDRAKLAAMISDADYYTYPTLAEKGEALPVAPLEAMATGLAPVVSDIPQFRDYLVHGENGLVFNHAAPDPAEELAAALRRLIDNPAESRAMGDRAAAKARSFGFSSVADLYLKDFEEIVVSRGRARVLPSPRDGTSHVIAPVKASLDDRMVAKMPAGGLDAVQPKDRLRTMRQHGRVASPWPLRARIRAMLWHVVWLTLFRTTPKPLNAWRLFLLRLFGCKVQGSPYVSASVMIRMPWHLELGEGSCVNYGVDLYTLGRIKLHPRCTVAQGAYLCTGTHDMTDPIYPLVVGDIEIGEEAFVGVRALIMPGVIVHEGGIVGGGAVVTKDVPPWTVVAGNPAKVIRAREFKGRQPTDPITMRGAAV